MTSTIQRVYVCVSESEDVSKYVSPQLTCTAWVYKLSSYMHKQQVEYSYQPTNRPEHAAEIMSSIKPLLASAFLGLSLWGIHTLISDCAILEILLVA